MAAAVELPTVSRLGYGQGMDSSPSPNLKNVKTNIRTFPANRLGSPIKLSQKNTAVTHEAKDFQHVLHRQETNLAHLVGTGRFQNAVAKAQGSRLEATNNGPLQLKSVINNTEILRRTVSCFPRRASHITESENIHYGKSVTAIEETKKTNKKISLHFSSNKQCTYKDVIIQLYRIWEPQLSTSYRPFVQYVPAAAEDEDRESCVSDAVGLLHNDPLHSMRTAGTAIEAVNRFNKKALFLNK